MATFHGQLSSTGLLSFSVGEKIVAIVASVAAAATALITMGHTLHWRDLDSQTAQPE